MRNFSAAYGYEMLRPSHILLLALISTSLAKTVLQQSCESEPRAYYYQSACFIGSENKTTYADIPNPACPKYANGHLAFITSASLLNKFKVNRDNSNLIPGSYWSGLHQLNETDEQMGRWAWVMPSGETYWVPKPNMTIWKGGKPDNQYGASHAAFNHKGVFDAGSSSTRYRLCQYDEPKTRQYKKFGSDVKGDPETLIRETSTKHAVDCALECNEYLVCGSFSFSPSINSCLLHWLDGQTQGYTPIDGQGYGFWVVV